MQFLLIIAHDDNFIPDDGLVSGIMAWIKQAEAAGMRVHGNPLRPASEGVTLRVRHGKLEQSGGPFSRSTEQMCAYELLECPSLDAAIELAARHPMAAAATIEVRPVWGQLAAPASM
nr:YciI family protein [uncultured Roseateles sp.]